MYNDKKDELEGRTRGTWTGWLVKDQPFENLIIYGERFNYHENVHTIRNIINTKQIKAT